MLLGLSAYFHRKHRVMSYCRAKPQLPQISPRVDNVGKKKTLSQSKPASATMMLRTRIPRTNDKAFLLPLLEV